MPVATRRSQTIQVNKHISSEFDPFRVVISFASEANSADLFIETFTGIGLTFDLSLTSAEDCSHGTRIRALRPRAIAAYEGLSTEARLAAANAATGRFLSRVQQLQRVPEFQGLSERMLGASRKIGWGFEDDHLVTLDPEIREMFFPKGSQWDAFVTIREMINTAQSELMLVDPYCDRAFFDILQSSTARPKTVRLLCRNNPAALKTEAQAFGAQVLSGEH